MTALEHGNGRQSPYKALLLCVWLLVKDAILCLNEVKIDFEVSARQSPLPLDAKQPSYFRMRELVLQFSFPPHMVFVDQIHMLPVPISLTCKFVDEKGYRKLGVAVSDFHTVLTLGTSNRKSRGALCRTQKQKTKAQAIQKAYFHTPWLDNYKIK